MTAVNLGLAGIMDSKAVVVVVVGILCLLSGTLASSAPLTEKTVYGAKGGSVVFSLEQPLERGNVTVTSLIWKYYDDIVAEWHGKTPDYHGKFKSTTKLDISTGALTISNLQPHFKGKYSFQVNHNDFQILNLAVIDPVYVVKGQPVTLEAKVANVHEQTAQWKLNNTVIAQLDGGKPKSRLIMDSKNYSLTILHLKENDTGVYTFTNDHHGSISYLLFVRAPVKIVKNCNSSICTLNCTGVDNENIQVHWTDNKGGNKSGSVMVVEKSEHLDVIYTCTSDSGSWKDVTVLEKDFPALFKGEGKIVGPIVGSIGVCVLLLAVGLGFALHKKMKGQSQDNEDAPESEENPLNGEMGNHENGQQVFKGQPQQNEDAPKSEEDPLNGGMGNHENDIELGEL